MGCIAGFREGRCGEIGAVVTEEADPTLPVTIDTRKRSPPFLPKAHTRSPMIVGEADPNAWIVGRDEQGTVWKTHCRHGLAGNTRADSSFEEAGVEAAAVGQSPSFHSWPAEVIVTTGLRMRMGRSRAEGS